MHLSDGGHFENLGLLPLLKLRLPKILVVNGSYIESDEDYATEIIRTMELARELFDCSFTSIIGDDLLDQRLDEIDKKCGKNVLNYIKSQLGGDVLTDINNKYVHSKDAPPPRKFEFKVRYSGKSKFIFNTNQRCTTFTMSKSNLPQTKTKATGHYFKYVRRKSKDTRYFVRCITDRYFMACIIPPFPPVWLIFSREFRLRV